MVADTPTVVPDYVNIEIVTDKPEQEATPFIHKKVLKAIESACGIKRQQGEEGGGGQVSMDESQLPGREGETNLLVNYAESIHEESVKKLLVAVELEEAAKEMNPRRAGGKGLAAAWQVGAVVVGAVGCK